MKRYSILFVLAFLLLLFLFGCGSPPQDIGGGQSSQNQEAVFSSETPVALSGDSVSSEQELTSQEGETLPVEEGAQEDIFAVYGDDKLIAAWSTDAEGNNCPISKEKAEKLIPSDFMERMKSCKAFNVPQLYRQPSQGGANYPGLPMDSSNGVAYFTDALVRYAIKFSNIPNPCSTPFVFALGWVSPVPSENTITKYAPVPGCAAGGILKYTSGTSYYWGPDHINHPYKWSRIASDYNGYGSGIVGIYSSAGSIDGAGYGNGWYKEIFLISQRVVHLRELNGKISDLSLGQWQIPTYAGSILDGAYPKFWMGKLAVDNLSVNPHPFMPGGGRKLNITGDIVCHPKGCPTPKNLNWEVNIGSYTAKGTGNKIKAPWDGLINGKPVSNGMYSYLINVNAPDAKTSCSVMKAFGVGIIEIDPTAIRPKPAAGSYPVEMTTVTVLVPGNKKAKVKIVAEAVRYSGGHQHTGSRNVAGKLINGRPIGRFYTTSTRTTERGTEGQTNDGYTRTYETDTDSTGKLTLYYEPSLFGGIERLKATVTNNTTLTGSVDLIVQVPGLVALPASKDYILWGQTNAHPVNHNHYGTSAVVAAIPKIFAGYRKTHPNEALFILNDMSVGDEKIGYGGLFDIGPPQGKFWINPHIEHRLGTNLDLNFENNVLPPEDSTKALDIIAAFQKVLPNSWKRPEGNHWHWYL